MALFRFTPRRCRELQVSHRVFSSLSRARISRLVLSSSATCTEFLSKNVQSFVSRLASFEIRNWVAKGRRLGLGGLISTRVEGTPVGRNPAVPSSIDRCAAKDPPVRARSRSGWPPNLSMDARMATFVSGDCSLPRGGSFLRLLGDKIERFWGNNMLPGMIVRVLRECAFIRRYKQVFYCSFLLLIKHFFLEGMSECNLNIYIYVCLDF